MAQAIEDYFDAEFTQIPLEQLNHLRLQNKLIDMVIMVGGKTISSLLI